VGLQLFLENKMTKPISLEPPKKTIPQWISKGSSFRVQWLLSTGLGWIIGIWANRLLIPLLYKSLDLKSLGHLTFENTLVDLILGGLTGLIMGTAQWLVLRKLIRYSGGWIMTNVLGWALAYVVHEFVVYGVFYLSPNLRDMDSIADSVGLIVMGVVLGISLSLLQWPILKDNYSDPKLIFLSRMIGWTIGMTVYVVFVDVAFVLPNHFRLSTYMPDDLVRAINATSSVLHLSIGFIAAWINGRAFAGVRRDGRAEN
jgi:hypothetical protein